MNAVMIIGAPQQAPAFAFEQAPFVAAPAAAAPDAAGPANNGASAAEPASDAASATVPPTAVRTIGPNGRLREQGVPDSDRTYATVMHLSPLAFLWIGPLALAIPIIMWIARKDRSAFTDDHGREIANFSITWMVLSVALVWTVVVPVVLTIVAIVNVIRGAVAASRNEYFRYPMTIRFL